MIHKLEQCVFILLYFNTTNIGINIPFSLSSSVEAFSFFTLFSFFTTALSELEVFALVESFEASIKKMNIKR